MGSIILIQKIKVQTLSFEKHPCSELDVEEKIHYLNGLALVSNMDDEVSEKEREYLSILINSFNLNEEMLDDFVKFAKAPDERGVLEMMQSFQTKDIKYNFMVDAMMMAGMDGDFDKQESALIEQFFEMLKVTQKEAGDLKYIYEMFHTQNGNALYRYFKRNEYMKVELFQYLLDYYKIDMAYELVEDEKKILTFEFFKPTFEKGKLEDGATEIMTKPVSNAQFCIFLNSAFMDNSIEIDGNGKVVDSQSKDLLMDLDNSDVEFKDGVFLVNSAEDDEKKIKGVTYTFAEMFIEWASEFNNEKYGITYFRTVSFRSFGQMGPIDLSSFSKNSMSNEFFYAKDNKYAFEDYFYWHADFNYDEYSSINHASRADAQETGSFRMMKLPKDNHE